ncbi:DUF4124 domain-containing protein [Pseudomonas zhanjiangensis]|uniref:DUF4124 domain-containing protein n=1 Tax=Pseudomonas zhanjiangensis TaxID=3239015 RepID=A0ABV3YW91_9PSED
MRLWFCCLLLLPGLAAAEVYRWVDADGQVHFGQRPNAQGAERVEVKPQVVERDAATRERQARSERFYEARRQEQAQARSRSVERQTAHRQECSQLRQQLAQMPEGFRYYRSDADGQRSYYSDEEMDAARRQLRERVAQRCS